MKIIKYLWIFLGSVFMALGILGIFLPMLPTTPFFIGTLFCFTKGSEKLKNRFLKSRIYKRHLRDFAEHKGMPLKNKIIILLFASAVLGTAFYFSNNLYARIMIVCIAALKYYVFIFKIKTISSKPDERQLLD